MILITETALKRIIIFISVILLIFIAVNIKFSSSEPQAVTVFNSEHSNMNLDKQDKLRSLLDLNSVKAERLLKAAIPGLKLESNQQSFTNLFNHPKSVINLISKLLIGTEINQPMSLLESELPLLAVSQINSQQVSSQTSSDNNHPKELEINQETTNSELFYEETKQSSKLKKLYNNNLVAIYHSHTSESYDSSVFNFHSSPGTKGDIVDVGSVMSKQLNQQYQIKTIHATRVNDQVYRESYSQSRKLAQRLVSSNSNLKLVLDLHRDALAKENKDIFTTTINGERVAKVMIVVARPEPDYGLPHPDWQQNLELAERLAAKTKQMYPGLLREMKVVDNRRYNQDVHPHSLLLEVGGIDNTTAEAKRSAKLMADVIAAFLTDELED
ncbi:MAG: stage II sporulation protein P [Bacillota bacterium]